MIKKALIAIVFATVGLLTYPGAHAQTNNCQTVQFPEGSVCVWIERVSSGQYRVRSSISSNQSTLALRCDIEYGQTNVFRQGVGACDGTFYYASNNTESVSIDIWLGSNTARRITQQYNFGNGSRSSSNNWNNNWNNNRNNNWSNTLYDLDVYASTTSPNINQSISINIMALQNIGSIFSNYNGTVQFSVQQWNNNTWQTAPSNSYYLDRSSYSFSWSNAGQVQLNNLIEFRTSGIYRLITRDTNTNITKYTQFSVGSSNNWNNQNFGTIQNFGLSSNRINPSINQSINVTIQARDSANRIVSDYNRSVSFSVQYRQNNNSSRQTAPSSSYRLNRTSYSFTPSDYGQVTLNNLLEFRTNGNYRLVVQDNWNNVIGYLNFSVGGSNNSSNTPGFTTAQMTQIQGLYNLWPAFIQDMEKKYPRLRNNTTWRARQAALYQEMNNIIRGSNSLYSSYDQFFVEFRDWYVYTLQVR